jgi:hypothetical protein
MCDKVELEEQSQFIWRLVANVFIEILLRDQLSMSAKFID